MLLLIPMLGLGLIGLARRSRRRRPIAGPRPIPRRHSRQTSLLIVIAIVAVTTTIGTPAFAGPFDDPCGSKTAPQPEFPGAGLVGTIDPPTLGAGTPGSVYEKYSYAGLVWNTYDLGCTALSSPGAQLDTWLGNQTFSAAKDLVGLTNWAHYAILDGSGDANGNGSLMSPIDGLIRTGVNAMWNSIFLRWISIALVVLSVMLLIWSGRGDLPKQTQRLALALVALTAAAASYLAPTTWSNSIDQILFDATAQLHDGFLPDSNRDTLPTLLVDRVVWDNWLRGEFGSVNSYAATQHGADLLAAQAFSKTDVICPSATLKDPHNSCGNGREDNNPNVGSATADLADQKKTNFKSLADTLQKDGTTYTYFQGKKGSRVGDGVLALLEAFCLAFFQLFANIVLILAMIIIRLVIIAMPALAVIAVMRPNILANLLRLVGSALANALILAGLAGLHTMILTSIFAPNSGVDTIFALMLSLIISLLMWAVARPIKRMIAMTRMAGEQIGLGQYDPSSRMSRQLRRQYRHLNRRSRSAGDTDERWWNLDGEHAPAPSERPEQNAGTTTVRATIHRDGDSRTPRPHGPGTPASVDHGPAALPAGSGVTRVPSSGRPWAHARPDPKQLTGTTGRRALPAGTTTTTTGSAPNDGRGGGDPTGTPTAPRALPAGTGNGPPSDRPPPTTTTPRPAPDTAEPPRPARALPAGERNSSAALWDTDSQSMVTERGSGPDPRAADLRTDADGTPVYVVVWDTRSQTFQHDQLPPTSPPADEDAQ